MQAQKAPLTAAEHYAQLKEKKFEDFIEQSFSEDALKDVPLFEVKCPSGMPFKCRKIDLAFQQQTGNLPMALSEQMMSSAKSDDESNMKAWLLMPEQQKRAAIEASARMVRYICVKPRLIIGEVNGHKNAISTDSLTVEDFGHLAKWAQSGGDVAEGLKTFRRKRR